MRYVKIIATVFAVAILAQSAYAKKKKDTSKKQEQTETVIIPDLSTWAKEQAAALPQEVDGVTIMRPVANEDGKAEVSELIDIDGVGRDNVFIGAVVYAAENLDRATDAIETIDFDNKRFVVSRKVRNEGTTKDAATYTYTTAFQSADNILSFVSYDIDVEYREKGILPRHLTVEKMKPSTNKRHSELIEEFSLYNSKYLKGMADYIKENSNLKVTHWADIKDGVVVKGMNETEVKLIGGVPLSIREMGNRKKWMFSNDFVVIFTDGKVTTVIQ